MKKSLLVLVILFFALSLYAQQEPSIKFHFNDENFKNYNIEDISKVVLIHGKSGYLMTIFYEDSLRDYYSTENIKYMVFDIDSSNNIRLNINILEEIKRYILEKVDSINFSKIEITKVVPLKAIIGSEILITGEDFGIFQDSSYLSFNNLKALEYLKWNDSTISVKIPQRASSGKISVTVKGTKSNEMDFTIVPNIKKLALTSEKKGNEITVTGTGFGTMRGKSIVSFNGTAASEYTSWSDTIIIVKVPPEATTGKVCVTVAGTKSDEIDYTLIPYIINVSPTSSRKGNEITITGTGFGTSRGNNFVSFSKINKCEYTSWETSRIRVLVPQFAQTGMVSITINGNKSNEIFFPILPYISSINPTIAEVGDEVFINGSGFGRMKDTSVIYFNNTCAMDFTSWEDTQILLKIPQEATSGKVSITVDGIISNEVYFTVIQPVVIGTQIWMLKNLDIDHYRTGDFIPQITDPLQWEKQTGGAWCFYNNNDSNNTEYGKLYNWYAINDFRGLAPKGWHVASDEEWTKLVTYLGGDSIAGAKLKEAGLTHWQSTNEYVTNESGLTALPGGRRTYGAFNYIGSSGSWWSSSEYYAPTHGWSRCMFSDKAIIFRNYDKKTCGFSVRCVKDQ